MITEIIIIIKKKDYFSDESIKTNTIENYIDNNDIDVDHNNNL